MLRRSHKKSRAGCRECKRRHIKCDERKPVCANCTMGERHCDYPEPAMPEASSTLDGTSPQTSSSVDISLTPPDNAPEPIQLPNIPPESFNHLEDGDDAAVNLNHMELMMHFTVAIAVPDTKDALLDGGTRIVLKAAANAPYLIHEILSISARHLAFLHPEKADFYHHQSVQMQTKSISIFNETLPTIDATNCVALILYSSMVSRHLLADTLANRDPNIKSFIDGFVRYIHFYKGMSRVANEAWPLLEESELMPLIKWNKPPGKCPGVGHECDQLRYLIRTAPHLDPSEIDACQTAIEQLQVGFDEVANPSPGRSPYNIAFTWSVLLPTEFAHLLEQYKPEAIVVLAYYGVLLLQCTHLWQIADAGAYLVSNISEYLGPEWAQWLWWPQMMLNVPPLRVTN
ncbi:hypothetical protein F5B20DRAFT_304356 [Whalleya microplaca]|nr:hypothetical protein F5B20DRAFT_304356 [Whalleya microplaca]